MNNGSNFRRVLNPDFGSDASDVYMPIPQRRSEIGNRDFCQHPLKTMELLAKTGLAQKAILRTEPQTFGPWLNYINSVLNGAWLNCMTKMNIYRVPPVEDYQQWDQRSRNSGQMYMKGFNDDCTRNIPIVSWLDQDGSSRDFNRHTPIDILNAATLTIFDAWPQLCHVLSQILVTSIDKSSMPYLIPDSVGTPKAIRSMYFEACKFHKCSSESIIGIKVANFNNPNSLPTHTGEPPLAYLERLRLVMQEINDMSMDNAYEPISMQLRSS